MAQIGGLNTTSPPYGNLAGGWHLATHDEMTMLFSHTPLADITVAFGHSYYEPSSGDTFWMGRAQHLYPGETDARYCPIVIIDIGGVGYALHGYAYYDSASNDFLGAWVTTDAAVVPAPGALVLAAFGLLSSALGLKRWRHKS